MLSLDLFIANDVALGFVESYQMGPKFHFGVAKSIIVWKTQALSFLWRWKLLSFFLQLKLSVNVVSLQRFQKILVLNFKLSEQFVDLKFKVLYVSGQNKVAIFQVKIFRVFYLRLFCDSYN